MKTIYLLIPILFCTVISAQELVPTAEKALVKLTLKDKYKEPFAGRVYFFSEKQAKEYTAVSKHDGTLEILVPVNDEYKVYTVYSFERYELSIPAAPNADYHYDLEFDNPSRKIIAPRYYQSLIKYTVLDPDKNPKILTIEFVNNETGKTYSRKTDCNGNATLPLPNKSSYTVNLTGAPGYDAFELGDENFGQFQTTLILEGAIRGTLFPSVTRSLINFKYYDLKHQPVAYEEITAVRITDGKEFKAVTNENGLAQILVPIGAEYRLNATYKKNVTTVSFKNVPDLYIRDINFTFLSSIQYEEEMRKREKEMMVRDSVYESRRGKSEPSEIADMKKEVEEEVALARKGLAADPKYFEKKNMVICAVLNKMKEKWKNKMIVTDLTGSMYPYANELMVWHMLKLAAGERNEYVFFNDGDMTPDYLKKIGETGGIYQTEYSIPDSVIATMLSTMDGGCGGDGPENDIEALIEAQKQRNGNAEMIMIVDNYSAVKDIELLGKITQPVHIILCGYHGSIHPDYLKIAYETKGSIHTIEEEIDDLATLTEGKTIQIGSQRFILIAGEFLPAPN